MKGQVGKWGNSLAVRLPKGAVEDVGLQNSAPVEISWSADKIVITPVLSKSKLPEVDLEKLVKGISAKNRHEQIFDDEPVGREVW
jgi:antitoxin MazE